ncbi:MAG: hypothetical protein RI887_159 [Actinomycetota bacterium]|jgi:hypothetical protein
MNKWSDKGNDPFGPFNMSDFKKWMNQQHDANKSNMVGLAVESKIPYKRLVSRIEVQEGDDIEVAKNFKKHGGTITEENGHYMYVKTKGGSFMIHRMHLKRSED